MEENVVCTGWGVETAGCDPVVVLPAAPSDPQTGPAQEPADLELLALEVTNRCNMRCKMCVSHGAGLYQGQADGHPPLMDPALFRSLVDQYADLEQAAVKQVLPQFQGEPLLHPQFLDLCQYLERKKMRFSFTTNGALLKPALAAELLDMEHFFAVTFSVDGANKQTYEAIRRGANYDVVMQNIESFLALPKRPKFATSVNFTMQPENEAEVEEFVRHWAPRVDFLGVSHVAINGRPVRLDWSPPRIPCGDLWHFMICLTNGLVVPCCRDYRYQMVMGDASRTPLRDIWLGPKYLHMRELHARGAWGGLPLCGDCDTWMCRTQRREKETLAPAIGIEKGPFFLQAKKRFSDKLDYQLVPFAAYHPLAAPPKKDAPGTHGRRLKILVLAHVYPFDASTILDHASSLGRYSRHQYFYVNAVGKQPPFWLRMDDFDAVVVHYSISVITPYYLGPAWVEALQKTNALKIMFIQDEYRMVDAHVAQMANLGLDVLFTCVPFSEVPKVYPREKLPHTKVFCTLTGFVPEYLEKASPEHDKPRPIDVGYRARTLGFWYGALGREKHVIGQRFRELAAGTDLVCDISSREEDRIYGKAWLRFLRSCRCVLGTESGASVFDFTGEIERQTKEYVAAHPEARFETVREAVFKDEEGKVRLNQISPRVFEATACGAALVLFEGEYSGILKPDVHFIPLKKDFSNFPEVLQKIRDPAYVGDMARRAHEDIIAPGRYSYRAFAQGFDRALALVMIERARLVPAAGAAGAPTCAVSVPRGRGYRALRIVVRTLRAARWAGWAILRRLARKIRRWVGLRTRVAKVRSLLSAQYVRFKWWGIQMLTDWQPLYRRNYLRMLVHTFVERVRRP